MPAMIWVSRQYGHCPVDLFRGDSTGELVGQRHRTERKQQACLRTRFRGPAVRRPDGHNHGLSTTIPYGPKMCRKLFARELPPTAVQQDEIWVGAPTSALKPRQQCAYRCKVNGFRGEVARGPCEELRRQQGSRRVFLAGAGTTHSREVERHPNRLQDVPQRRQSDTGVVWAAATKYVIPY